MVSDTTFLLCFLIAEFEGDGRLPAGIHWATWTEICSRFGTNDHRKVLLMGLKRALSLLKDAGCVTVYIDGSFVTSKNLPNDYDCCWEPAGVDADRVDRTFLDTSPQGRARQKMKFGGEFFVSSTIEGGSREPFLDFFQTDTETGRRKGIIAIDLRKSL
jgi:hypothetical protein